MKIVDLPRPAPAALYGAAILQYVRAIRSRAIAIYQVGNVRFPGLSDIDVLVVTDSAAADNRYFFSAFARLPQRYERLFLHEPFIVPANSARIVSHTSHSGARLLAGRDVLAPWLSVQPSKDERWCHMLESYCAYAAFAARCREQQHLRGRMTVAVASALRFLIRDANALLGHPLSVDYEARIDALRTGFFDGDPVAGVLAAWELFCEGFEEVDAAVRRAIGCAPHEDAAAASRALLHGERTCENVQREFAFRRARSIAAYQGDLAAMGFPYGHLFFAAAFPSPVVPFAPHPVLGNLVRNAYRVKRRLAELAHA